MNVARPFSRVFMHATRIFGLLAALACGNVAHAHNPMLGETTAQLGPGTLEIRTKLSAEAAWMLVQKTVAPGAVFVLEDFDRVGRAILTKFAQRLSTVTADGRPIAPKEIHVAVVDDDFEFRLVYPTQAGRVRVAENYVAEMPVGFISSFTVRDAAGAELATKLLARDDLSIEVTVKPARTS